MENHADGGNTRLTGFITVLNDELSIRKLIDVKPYQAFAIDRLRKRAGKKCVWTTEEDRLHDEALSSFLELNEEVKNFVLPEVDPVVIGEARDFIFRAITSYHKYVDPDSVQETFSWPMVLDNWRFGPGSSNGVRGTHFVDKIEQKFSATFQASPWVRLLNESNPYLLIRNRALGGDPIIEVPGSRLTTVPKSNIERRVIAVEPSGNMALQLGWGAIIEGVLAHIGCNLKNQQAKNRYLARIGSIADSHATIDLRKASDRQAMQLIELLWPEDCIRFMAATRSYDTSIRWSDGNVTVHKLNVLSTMGNGWTFPVMTLTLMALCYANARCYFGQRSRRFDHNNFCVNGDDIICPSEHAEALSALLDSVGYAVNSDKSYLSGPFRESCGGDFWNGFNVTPFYVQHLRSETEVYVALNQLAGWVGRTQVPLYNTAMYLLSLLKGKTLFVPEWYADEAGIRRRNVPKFFEYLRLKAIPRKLRETPMAMMIALGGYADGAPAREFIDGTHKGGLLGSCITRESRIKTQKRKGKLPTGWLSGWDPLSRSQGHSSYVESFWSILT